MADLRRDRNEQTTTPRASQHVLDLNVNVSYPTPEVWEKQHRERATPSVCSGPTRSTSSSLQVEHLVCLSEPEIVLSPQFSIAKRCVFKR